MAYLLAKGLGGITQNDNKAFALYKKLAENQNHAISQNNLGWCYKEGSGTEQDLKKAFEWYQKSADQKYLIGINSLSYCYRNGIGTDKNESKAFNLYRQLENYNHPEIQNSLADCYLNGSGTETDVKKGYDLYLSAANQDYPVAQYNVGSCLSRGIGVDQNKSKALAWYARSANQNYPRAKALLIEHYIELKETLSLKYKKEEKDIKKETDEKNEIAENAQAIATQYPSLPRYHQQLAAQIPAVKGWVLEGPQYLFHDGLLSIVLSYLIINPYLETNKTEDYIKLRDFFFLSLNSMGTSALPHNKTPPSNFSAPHRLLFSRPDKAQDKHPNDDNNQIISYNKI